MKKQKDWADPIVQENGILSWPDGAKWNRRAGINNAWLSIRLGFKSIWEGVKNLYCIYIQGRGY